jgi:nitroimidazol reductase NimA-like FMN-containing flavoprotein (pyridoxamine 5'-phosphate oxidase superfamily)
MEARNLADLYDLPLVDWQGVVSQLDAGLSQAPGTGGPDRHTCWLATIDDDGRPHVTGIGAVWHEGSFWFETGASTRKGRNVARDPRCTLSVAADRFDLVVEGEAEHITDPAKVAELAAIWAVDWPCTVDESGTALTAEFSAPSAGKPPWQVYRINATSAMVLQIDPAGAARFTF